MKIICFSTGFNRYFKNQVYEDLVGRMFTSDQTRTDINTELMKRWKM